MSLHINAKPGDIAETILLPGDPLRAKFIAEKFLNHSQCFNEVRGMYGYTGFYKGKRVSVMGSGMGQASLGIYVNELIDDYRVKNIIRVGSCGSYQKEVNVRDIILAQSASTDAAHNKKIFKSMDFAPCANFNLLLKAHNYAQENNIAIKVGNILSSDTFYDYNQESWKLWADFGILAVEMESNLLYSIAALKKVNALSILTVSDSLVTGESTSAQERQCDFIQMMDIGLNI